jgi:glutathione synthase/RimK-type ligase-like ATP-grasp enzyme
MTLGIAYNPHFTNVPNRLIEAAAELDVSVRVIDLLTLTVEISLNGEATVRDTAGAIEITSLAPYLFFGYPTAVHAFRILSQRAFTQNPVDSVLTADDKAATAVRLSQASLPQVPSIICSLDLERALSAAEKIQYPVVIKHTQSVAVIK